MHVSKNSEIVRFFFHLAINIVVSKNNFHFILPYIEITMYQCIMLSCIILCYHHEFHDTYVFYKGRIIFKIIWTRGCHVFGFMVVVG